METNKIFETLLIGIMNGNKLSSLEETAEYIIKHEWEEIKEIRNDFLKILREALLTKP